MSLRPLSCFRPVVVLALAGVALGSRLAEAQGPPSYSPTSQYEIKRVEGWAVYIHKDLVRRHAMLTDRALDLLRSDLVQIEHRVPSKAVERLRTIRIWIEDHEKTPVGLSYNPDVRSVRALGKNPEKARGIEIGDVRNYLTFTLEQPSLLLHELAHAYHHQFVPSGFQNAEIRTEYDRVIRAKLYDSVMRWDGKSYRPHSIDNAREYFADATETVFGTNDHYPFVYPELLHHDPETARLIVKHWGGKTPHPSELRKTLDR